MQHRNPSRAALIPSLDGAPARARSTGEPSTPGGALNRKAEAAGGPPDLASAREVAGLFGTDPALAGALDAVAFLGLPDCWVVAGFVRNAVWDRLHGYAEPTPLADIDVIYFDAAQRDEAIEKHLEAALHARLPGRPWSVKNQARMHERNGDPPYRSSAHALTCWCETATAVGVRRAPDAGIELLAPFGVGDLLGLIVRPTPFAARHKLAAYRQRLAEKNWPALWPRLTVHDA